MKGRNQNKTPQTFHRPSNFHKAQLSFIKESLATASLSIFAILCIFKTLRILINSLLNINLTSRTQLYIGNYIYCACSDIHQERTDDLRRRKDSSSDQIRLTLRLKNVVVTISLVGVSRPDSIYRRLQDRYGPPTEEEEETRCGGNTMVFRCSDVSCRRSGAVAWADLRCLRRLLLLLQKRPQRGQGRGVSQVQAGSTAPETLDIVNDADDDGPTASVLKLMAATHQPINLDQFLHPSASPSANNHPPPPLFIFLSLSFLSPLFLSLSTSSFVSRC